MSALALEKLARLADLSRDEAREVAEEWPLTLAALRSGVTDETRIFCSVNLEFLRGRLEAELDERLHAWVEVAQA